ncbi:MAG: hypothetical protein F4205_18160 [Gemmatimonadetes bacterium]|nr:hypothetical protein [Chloroflexota bacterium]MYG37398.1 hypothetical protein [Gemmatimonadota bacterium]
MAIRLDRPVTVRRSGSTDSVNTWARVEDAGTFEETSGDSVYGVSQREFTVRFIPFLTALGATDGEVGAFDISKLEIVFEGHVYTATNLVELERRRYHRITAGRRLYYRFIGSG